MAFWNKKKNEDKTRITVAEILKTKSGEDAIIEIDNILTPIFYKNPESLTAEERVVVFIEEYEREINNGGFNQFYFNSAGNYYYEIIKSLEEIKSIKFLELLKKSSTPFPNAEIPTDRYKRQTVLYEIEDEAEELWDNLEQEFYKYDENIYGLLTNFITENIEKFR